MMTIIYISSEYPPETGNGGIGTYTRHIAEGMHQRGHTVYVICKNPGQTSRRTIQNGVHVHRIPSAEFPLPQAPLFFPFRAMMRALFYHTLVRISWAIAAGKEVAYISNLEKNLSVIEYPECGAEGLFVPCTGALRVVRLHTSWSIVKKIDNIRECPGDELFFPVIEKTAIKRADVITSPSKAMIQKTGLRSNKHLLTVIPNPIPSGNFKPAKGDGWIYTGRVERRKGVHILISAYASLCSTHSAPNLTIVGAPYGTDAKTGIPYEMYIDELINNSGCSEKIKWYRGIPLEQVYELLHNSSVAFFSSLWENFPYSCLEAMACGCAVVASNCGGFPEMITHDVNGLLVTPSSVDSLKSSMIILLESANRTKQLGAAARVHVSSQFDSTIICKQVESFYISGIGVRNHEK